MTEAKHTPTPWMVARNLDRGLVWIDSFDAPSEGIADLYHRIGINREEFVSKANCEANARLIVRAVNAHDDLVLAAKEAAIVIADAAKAAGSNPMEGTCLPRLMSALAKAEAA